MIDQKSIINEIFKSMINDARGASLTYDQISGVVVVVVVVSDALFSANTEPIWKILSVMYVLWHEKNDFWMENWFNQRYYRFFRWKYINLHNSQHSGKPRKFEKKHKKWNEKKWNIFPLADLSWTDLVARRYQTWVWSCFWSENV